jgi:hypothetical protein
MRARCFLVLLVTVACTSGHARNINPYADAERDCRSATTLLAPAREPTPHMAPALWRLRVCPARAGELLAAVLLNSRTIADTGQLEARTWLTHYLHDARLLAAGAEVATDSLATPEARLAALRILLWSKAPGHLVPMRTMVERPGCDPRRCRSTYTGHFYGGGPIAGDTTSWPVFGTPMPAQYVTKIDSIARLVEIAPGTPMVVQRAARVVRQFPPDPELKGR